MAGRLYDPETHIVYVYSRRPPGVLGLVKPDPAKNDMNYVQGARSRVRAAVPMGAAPGQSTVVATGSAPAPAAGAGGGGGRGRGGDGEGGGGGGLSVQGLPIVKPPYGSISAISLDKGEILWQIAHGDTPDPVRNHPALKGIDIPRASDYAPRLPWSFVICPSSVPSPWRALALRPRSCTRGRRTADQAPRLCVGAGQLRKSAPRSSRDRLYHRGV